MPAAPAVEELGAGGSEDGKQVLEVRCRGGQSAEGHRVSRAPSKRKEEHAEDAARELELPVRDVSVWNPIARQMERRTE
jgi:hypothetical protein